jgi:formate hydrogenlyase subunit 6/NADH:ubiquinone oxidoreductase subunit I
MLAQLFGQMFKKPFTNKFPTKYAPKNVTGLLLKVSEGKATIVSPIAPPPNFRGKIIYEKEKCIGCKLCMKVCATNAIEFKEEEKKIKIFLSRCCFCSQCNDICPVKCLTMSNEFLLADSDKYAQALIVE